MKKSLILPLLFLSIAATADAEPYNEQSSSVPLEETIQGHLSGDQADPAPASMQQPVAEPLGEQPQATPSGMEQPTPEPTGDQPEATPPGMKQPAAEPIGDQPTPTPLGMEQPIPAQ